MKRLVPIVLALVVLFSALFPAPASAAPGDYLIPTFSIVSVSPDRSVTIRTRNFPAHDSFNVLMNTIGTHGKHGIRVATIASGRGGSFEATFDIPEDLYGLNQIAIRLESPYSGYFAYNWFTNNRSGYGTGGPYVDDGYNYDPVGYWGVPTFSITNVVTNKKVTIRTHNFPANDRFQVLMGHMGTRANYGIRVDTISTGDGGAFTATFEIPEELRGVRQIAIRLQSPSSGYYAYNWFYNSSSGYGTGGPYVDYDDDYWSGYLSFTIQKVNRNKAVTIRTHNLPADEKFDVHMWVGGTYGYGYFVETFKSGEGGTQSFKFQIPAALRGVRTITIRIQSRQTGNYAYNWFYNSTY